MPSSTPSDLAAVEARLAHAERDLDAHIARIEAEARANGSASISFGKRIGDGTSVAVERLNEIAILDRLTTQRRSVVRARAKVDDGSYGSCDGCDQPIGPDRLAALPWAIHCLACADLEAVPDDEGRRTSEAPAGPTGATADRSSPWDDVRWAD